MKEENKTTDYARKYFKECNIDYSTITREDINKLIVLLEWELKHHKHFRMKLSKIVHFNSDNGVFKHCYLYVNGGYFRRRQAIDFESKEWIGFAGWACTNNTQPFIKAFIAWCDLMTVKDL